MKDFIIENKTKPEAISEELKTRAFDKYKQKEKEFGENELRELERVVMLKVVDENWMEHIDNMDELKDGIGLRAYGQKDPVVQYRIEGFEMFDQMIADIKVDVVKLLMNSQKRGEIKREETVKITNAAQESLRDLDNTKRSEKPVNTTVVNTEPKIGRNDPCICGSR
jgi:preprotein translocase subunit SecA